MHKYIVSTLLTLAFCTTAMAKETKDTLTLRIMTYNLRFGELSSLEQLSAHIKAFQPDFVALEEVDCFTKRERAPHQHNKDFISTLAYKTGMFGLYGKAIAYQGGWYGIGLLSKHPYINVEKVVLPNPENKEPRVLLYATCEVGTDTLVFAVTHLDVNSSRTRSLQADTICRQFEKSPYPVIIGGDFNAQPDEPAIAQVMLPRWFNATDSTLTFPTWQPKIKIDYLFCRPQARWQLVTTQTVQSLLSDHLPIVSTVRLLPKR